MIKYFFIFIFLLSFNIFAAGTSSNEESNIDNSDQIKILYERAEKYIEEKKFNKSVKVLNSLTKREDLSGFRADIYNLLGYSYRNIKKPNLEKSFAAYMMALEIDPNHIGAHEYLGELYLMLGQKDKAMLMLDKLEQLTGIDSKEYNDLKEAINNY